MLKLPQDDLERVLLHTRPLWDEVRGRRIFLTGGTGFFGCWLVESFLYVNQALSLHADVSVLTRDASAFLKKCPHLANNPSLHLVTGDVCALTASGRRYDFVIHAATEASARLLADHPLEMFSTILDGTRRTLEFARDCGARSFLLASSGAVYGSQPSHITHLREDYLSGPDCREVGSAYGEGKRAAELMSILYAKDHFDIKIARCFAFVGPHLPLDSHFAIGNFIRDAIERRPITVGGDGTPKRSYLYAADLAIWLWTIFLRKSSATTYNVGSEQAFSIAELAHAVAAAINPESKVIVSHAPDHKSPMRQYIPSTSLAQTDLGLRETFTLADSVKRTAAWYVLNQKQSLDA
jgi:nucleoside-diphosphate-sugar epimerase